MTVSGIVVVCRPEHAAEVTRVINALPWAEVHHSDATARLVVAVEATDTDESMTRLRDIQQLPHVIMAELGGFYEEQES